MPAADYRILTDATGQRIAAAIEALDGGEDGAKKTDLTSIIATGTTNQTGAAITAGTYFYLNGTLVRALIDIASGATFTSGTNYEVVTAGGLNALIPVLYGGTGAISSVETGIYTEVLSVTIPAGLYIILRGCDFNANSTGVRRVGKSNNAGREEFTVTNATITGDTVVQHFEIIRIQSETTIKNVVYQTSGSTLSIWPYMKAIKIA